ncbi:DUF177 domain-containing protein [Proteinivorax tanatarense]|uniref:DUF177 domain-containing protein n=1 Tax=Proteinivorax tanatarense TaxID=1260629 RepID=A0AAU7VPU8_9FIRM
MVNNLLTINLLELETEKNLMKEYSYTIPKKNSVIIVPNGGFIEPIKVSATVSKKQEQTYLIEGLVETQLKLPCDRCLSLNTLEVKELFKKQVLVTNQEIDLKEEDSEGFYRIPIGRLPLKELLQEAIEFSIPSKFLCQKNCLGLCYNCGTNLNDGQCGCDKNDVDPRLAVLKKYYDKKK